MPYRVRDWSIVMRKLSLEEVEGVGLGGQVIDDDDGDDLRRPLNSKQPNFSRQAVSPSILVGHILQTLIA